MESLRHQSDYITELPPGIVHTVQQRAKQKKTRVNKAVIELFEESAGGKTKKKAPIRYQDLDHLVGTWTKEEAAALDKLIAEQRTREYKGSGVFVRVSRRRENRGILNVPF